jgi:hypothetical protein
LKNFHKFLFFNHFPPPPPPHYRPLSNFSVYRSLFRFLKSPGAFLIIPLVLLSCATGPANTGTPLWVTDKEAAYPDKEWLGFVETGADRNAAEAAAMNALAQSFRVDILSATTANQTLVSHISQNNKETIGESAEYRQFAQNITLLSQVSGLMGIEKDFWTGKDGTVYAMARMNRAECAARYRSEIETNEKLIGLVKQKAEEMAGTFEARANLRFAETVAELTDNLYSILSGLQKDGAGQKAVYGSAAEVRLLKQEASALVAVEVRVNGDVDGRIAQAFSAVLSERGFMVAGEGAGRYVLEADFRVEDDPQAESRYAFVRFVLDGVLKNRDGTKLVGIGENDREGHLLRQQAEQRAIRAAEEAIAGEGFAEKFDAYLDSVL